MAFILLFILFVRYVITKIYRHFKYVKKLKADILELQQENINLKELNKKMELENIFLKNTSSQPVQQLINVYVNQDKDNQS